MSAGVISLVGGLGEGGRTVGTSLGGKEAIGESVGAGAPGADTLVESADVLWHVPCRDQGYAGGDEEQDLEQHGVHGSGGRCPQCPGGWELGAWGWTEGAVG